MTYWQQAGEMCTKDTAKLTFQRWQEVSCPVVVASNTGATVDAFHQAGIPYGAMVCVTHMVGFREPGHDEMAVEDRQRLQSAGCKVLTTTHAFAGVDRGLRFGFQGIYPPEIIAHALRMLGQGTKVAVEIAIMALDAGLIRHGEPVLAVGGTGRGADTALFITPAHSNAVFENQIHEILCKPSAW